MKTKKYVQLLSLILSAAFLLSGCMATPSDPVPDLSSGQTEFSSKTIAPNALPDTSLDEPLDPVPDLSSGQTEFSSETVNPDVSPDTNYDVPSDPVPATPNVAEDLFGSLSLEEKIAQMFIVRCPQSDAETTISQNQFGGYVMFARDFKNKTKAQATADIKSYQNAARIPLLIAVDEEGGTVNRVSLYKAFRDTPFMSPQSLFADGGLPLIKEDTEEKCTLLKSLGINLNLAPVCDVSTNSKDYIYRRTFGQNAIQTAEYIKTVVSTMCENNMGAALKHFPGYGGNVDTHTGIAVDNRPLSQFRQSDFLPFKSGIDAGAGVVLVSHNIVTAIEPNRPASLSSAAHRILREELGFQGLIMTDDLSMGAIHDYIRGEEAAVMAVLAGNDLLCCTDYKTQYAAVLKAVKEGKISEARINESVLRILQYKFSAGLIA